MFEPDRNALPDADLSGRNEILLTNCACVGGFEICDAVLNNGVLSLDQLDGYMLQRGLPARMR